MYQPNDYHPYPLAMDDETPAARVAAAIALSVDGAREHYDAAGGPACSPAAVAAIARAVDRDYGETGYTVTIVGGNSRGAVARIQHSDGSRFLLTADRYENVRRVPDAGALACRVRPFDQEEAAA